MPIFTSSSPSIALTDECIVVLTYDGINHSTDSVNMWYNASKQTVAGSGSDTLQSSQISLNISDYKIGEEYTGLMRDIQLIKGIPGDDLISTYSYTVQKLFGYRFDNYRINTNNEFTDSEGGSNDLIVKDGGSNNSISLCPNSYMKFVSSLDFKEGCCYLESKTALYVPGYNLSDGIVLSFWVQIGSIGPIIHINDIMDVNIFELSGTTHIRVNNTDYLYNVTTSAHDAGLLYHADWLHVTIDTTTPTAFKVYMNGLEVSGTASTYTHPLAAIGSSQTLIVGYDGSNYLIGKIDAIFAFGSLDSGSVLQCYKDFSNNEGYANTIKYLDESTLKYSWNHVAASYDQNSKDLKIYHNGKLFTTYTNYIPNMDPTSQIVDNSNNMFVGRDEDGTTPRYFDGSLDDIRIYENTLSEDDVHKLYAQYYERHGLHSNLLINTLQLNVPTVTQNTNSDGIITDVTITDVHTTLDWKAICIADNILNSREIIEKIISDSNLIHNASVSVLSTTLSNVITVDYSEPGLGYEISALSHVNNFDIFVYAYDDSLTEQIVRYNINSDSNVGPNININSIESNDTSSMYIIDVNVFTSYSTMSKYYVYIDEIANQQNEALLISDGISRFVNNITNQVTNISTRIPYDRFSGSNLYVHVMSEDVDGERSIIRSKQI